MATELGFGLKGLKALVEFSYSEFLRSSQRQVAMQAM